jgi:hypothetical protein
MDQKGKLEKGQKYKICGHVVKINNVSDNTWGMNRVKAKCTCCHSPFTFKIDCTEPDFACLILSMSLVDLKSIEDVKTACKLQLPKRN